MTVGAIYGSQPGYPSNSYIGAASQSAAGAYGIPQDPSGPEKDTKAVLNPGESEIKAPGKRSSPAECETCKNRKYQDGSNEMVSFKAAAHISPQAAGSRVRAHEQEHVSNAYKKAAMNNGKVINASVTIQTAVCPECGRTYVSGGETTTQIKYYNEDNPYQKGKKLADSVDLKGRSVDLAG